MQGLKRRPDDAASGTARANKKCTDEGFDLALTLPTASAAADPKYSGSVSVVFKDPVLSG